MHIVLHVDPSIYAFQLEIHEVCLVLNNRVGKQTAPHVKKRNASRKKITSKNKATQMERNATRENKKSK